MSLGHPLGTLLGRWTFNWPARGGLLAILIVAAALTSLESGELQLLVTVLLCTVVAIAASGERDGRVATLWTVATIGLHGAGAWVRLAELSTLETGVTLGLVPAGIALLAWQSRALSQGIGRAYTTSEVARAKLSRANLELGSSMAETEAALGKLGTVVDNLSEGLVAVSEAGHVEFANSALARLLDLDEVRPGSIVGNAFPQPLVDLVQGCFEERRVNVGEIELPGRILKATASPVLIQDMLWGAVVLVRDVTLDKEIDRMKSDFIAVVSHEMRTPLTSVLGFTKLIQGQLEKSVYDHIPESDAKAVRARDRVRQNLKIVQEEGQRLTSLINDVLDITKMESGQMQWKFADQDAISIVKRALDSTGALFEAKPTVQADVQMPDSLPPIHADHDRILQVMINLLSNAVKFTDQGSITVRVKLRRRGVQFSVQDTGVGISAGNREAVFDKFRQVGDTLTDRPTGTGLGLPICREIVTQHGGRIWVESEVGVGSTFHFTVPFARKQPEGPSTGSLLIAQNRESHQ